MHCVIRRTEEKGRGVYASVTIPKQTLIEITPVLLFSKEEYANHGRHTILDHYTFKWTHGRMALALGLGSLFNHSECPNVYYVLDTENESIQYTTTRDVAAGEELCIFYGHKLWFIPAGSSIAVSAVDEDKDWDYLRNLTLESSTENPSAVGDPDELIVGDDLPFVKYKLPPEEEQLETIQTAQAWAVDIPDPRYITQMLKWLKQASLETPDLSHLKRVRKKDGVTSLLLATLSASPQPPTLLPELKLPLPYVVLVPTLPALTPLSLQLKCTFWPTLFTPLRKGEVEDWTRGKVHWAREAMKAVVEIAQKASTTRGELPIAALVAIPYQSNHPEASSPSTFATCDTRRSLSHPLKHAVINVIRQVADHHASGTLPTEPLVSASESPLVSSTIEADQSPGQVQSPELRTSGANYLLTSLTLFTTHEPCIMCSMALIHSRVKEVIYLHPMPKTGGCGGGSVCLPTLKGVNHRFSILRWKENMGDELNLDENVDA